MQPRTDHGFLLLALLALALALAWATPAPARSSWPERCRQWLPAALCGSGARTSAPREATGRALLLVDGRDRSGVGYPGEQPPLAPAARPALQQARAAATAYWRKRNAAYEEDFSVFGVAEGSFTRPGTRQQAVLYLLSAFPRCCPNMGVAVVEDGRLVGNFAFDAVAQQLATVPDLDGDGIDELAATGEFGSEGQSSQSLLLLSLAGNALRPLGSIDLGGSDCAADGRNGSTAQRVVAVAGKPPRFSVESFSSGCDSDAWKPLGGPRALQLPASTDPPFPAIAAAAR